MDIYDLPVKELKRNVLKGKTKIEDYLKFERYPAVSFVYYFKDDTAYDS